jgi:hypothetical protein
MASMERVALACARESSIGSAKQSFSNNRQRFVGSVMGARR